MLRSLKEIGELVNILKAEKCIESVHFTNIIGVVKGLEVRKNVYRRHFCKSISDVQKLVCNDEKRKNSKYIKKV